MGGLDTTINLGHILQLFAIIGGGVWFLWEMRAKLALLAVKQQDLLVKVDKIDSDVDKLSQVTIQIARQDERINAFERRIEDINTAMATRISEMAEAMQLVSSLSRGVAKLTDRTKRRIK